MKCHATTLACLVFSCVLATSCGWPGIKADTRGLGNSPTAQLLSKIWMNSADAISAEVSKLLESENETRQASVASATLAGFTCETSLVSCRYRGHVDYRLLNLPPENASREAGRRKILITVVNENPLRLQTTIDQDM